MLLIELQVSQLQAAHLIVKESLAGLAKENQQLADCLFLNARRSLRRSNRHTLNQQPQRELGFVEIDSHITERLRRVVGEADAAVFARPPLLALSILALTRLSLVLACCGYHLTNLPVSGATR